MADLIRMRPTCTPGKGDAGHDEHGKNHPNGQEGQWLDIWQTVAGADKSRAP
jgi:hypothetical protein